VDLVVKKKSLFFPDCDELLDLDVLFFDQLADPLIINVGFRFEIRSPKAVHRFSLLEFPGSFESALASNGFEPDSSLFRDLCATVKTLLLTAPRKYPSEDIRVIVRGR